MNGRLSFSDKFFHSAPNLLLISELCIFGLSWAILRRWPRDHTIKAFIGRLTLSSFFELPLTILLLLVPGEFEFGEPAELFDGGLPWETVPARLLHKPLSWLGWFVCIADAKLWWWCCCTGNWSPAFNKWWWWWWLWWSVESIGCDHATAKVTRFRLGSSLRGVTNDNSTVDEKNGGLL